MKIKYFLFFILLFAISSCSSLPSPQIVNGVPPAFSFLDIEPERTNNHYVMRMEKYNNIISECPIALYIMEERYLPDQFLKDLGKRYKDTKFMGVYSFNKKYKNMPLEFIFINNRFPPESILSTYFHEYSHYLHKQKQCLCFLIPDLYLQEEHALIGELELGLNYDTPFAVCSSIVALYSYVLDENTSCVYKKASLNVIKSEKFIEARKFIKEFEKEKNQ